MVKSQHTEKEINVNIKFDKEIIELFFSLTHKLKSIMATQAELAQQLKDLGTELGKIGSETTTLLQKITDLEGQIGNTDVSPELQAAFDAVKQQAQVVDDMVPDTPPTT